MFFSLKSMTYKLAVSEWSAVSSPPKDLHRGPHPPKWFFFNRCPEKSRQLQKNYSFFGVVRTFLDIFKKNKPFGVIRSAVHDLMAHTALANEANAHLGRRGRAGRLARAARDRRRPSRGASRPAPRARLAMGRGVIHTPLSILCMEDH